MLSATRLPAGEGQRETGIDWLARLQKLRSAAGVGVAEPAFYAMRGRSKRIESQAWSDSTHALEHCDTPGSVHTRRYALN